MKKIHLKLLERTQTTGEKEPVEWVLDKLTKNFPPKEKRDEYTLKDIAKEVVEKIDQYLRRERLSFPKELIKYIQALNPPTTKDIVVYRGMNLNPENKYDVKRSKQAATFLKKYTDKIGKEIKIKFGKSTSWSYNKNIAVEFTKEGNMGGSAFVNWAALLKTKIKPENVLLNVRYLPREMQVYIKQAEVILLPGDYEVELLELFDMDTGKRIPVEKMERVIPAMWANPEHQKELGSFKETFTRNKELPFLSVKEIERTGHVYKDVVDDKILYKRFSYWLNKKIDKVKPKNFKDFRVYGGMVSTKNLEVGDEFEIFPFFNFKFFNVKIDKDKPYIKIVLKWDKDKFYNYYDSWDKTKAALEEADEILRKIFKEKDDYEFDVTLSPYKPWEKK